jgi:signal transduction histidine kinase
MRHYHRDLYFVGPNDPHSIVNLNNAFAELRTQIGDYAAIDIEAVPGILPASEIREMADGYWRDFQPSIGLYFTDRERFDTAYNAGLADLHELQMAAEVIERVGERRADASLVTVDQANDQARIILLSVLAGVVLVGAALVWMTIRVISRFRQLYTSQQTASAQLELALQAKSDFIADASHELRTPLTVLRGNAEAGLAIDPNTVHREILEEIVSESARMTKLVEDLLFLARSDADSVPLDIEVIAAEPLLLELAERCRILVQREGADFTTRLDGYGLLNLDAVRIEQAVMILVDNAAKYGPAGGVVHLASSTWRSELIIEVADQGEGIPKDEIPFIFDRFRRVDNAPRRQRAGTGLGLAIAKTIVDAHSGRIEVHSGFGEGTQMRIYLPLDPSGRSRAAVRPIARALELAPGQRATE